MSALTVSEVERQTGETLADLVFKLQDASPLAKAIMDFLSNLESPFVGRVDMVEHWSDLADEMAVLYAAVVGVADRIVMAEAGEDK